MDEEDVIFDCEVCKFEMLESPTYIVLMNHGDRLPKYYCTLKCLKKWALSEMRAGVG